MLNSAEYVLVLLQIYQLELYGAVLVHAYVVLHAYKYNQVLVVIEYNIRF